ncbi:MAG: hypothetical protein ABI645_08965 [Pseudomonadota bacterium]
MQPGRGAVRPAIGIAFEGDFGTRIDALLAVAMLNGFIARNEARQIALGVSKPQLSAAQLAEVVAAFYSSRPAGGAAMVGVPEGTLLKDPAPLATTTLAAKTPEGGPKYTSGITRVLDTPDTAVLIRNQLLAQNDGNATIIVAGPATGMVRLMGLYGAPPQISAKVKQLVLAAGAFGSTAIDPAIKADVAAARKVFTDWPTPIVVAGTEVGAALPYPGASIAADFEWSAVHPVVDAYRLAKQMPYDAPAPALAAMLYAVKSDENFFKLSEPGTISVQDDGSLRFAAAPTGKHRYLIVDPAQKERVLATYTAMVSAKPRPSRGRGGGE